MDHCLVLGGLLVFDSLPTSIDQAATEDAPVTQWLRRLEQGDHDAAEPLWNHFCQKLMAIAKRRLSTRIQGAYDENDVAVSAFYSLCQGIQSQRFSLRDRDDLWRLLSTISERKVMRRMRSETAERRDVRRHVSQVFFDVTDNELMLGNAVESLRGHEPCPAYAAEFTDMCEYLLNSLADEKLKQVAILKLEMRTDAEIAAILGCTRRTIQRKLVLIRQNWLCVADQVDMAEKLN